MKEKNIKRPVIVIILLTIIYLTSCRKTNIPDKQDKPVDTISQWTRHTKLNSVLPVDQVNALYIDKNDVKWIGTANGLVRINGNDWTVFNTNQFPSSYITSIAVENNGTVWVGTTKGLSKYTGNSWTTYTRSNSLLPDDEIMAITYDRKNDITWVGTATGGFVRIQNDAWTVDDVYSNEVILSMAPDQDGGVWIGSFNHIAFRGNIRKYLNEHWFSYSLANLGYTSAFPYGLTVDKENRPIAALAGTVVKTVIRFNNGSWEEIDRPENAGGMKAITTEGDRIWVAGLQLAQFGNRQTPTIAIPGTDAPIQCIAIDSKGAKWLGTMGGGLAVYRDK